MAYDVVRPLMHEVLTMVNNAKVKGKKIEVLRKYSSEGLNTGISDIDAIETSESTDALGYQIVLETATESGTNHLITEDGAFIVQEDYNIDTIDTSSDSQFFETQGDSILDFTERNPFGEVT